MMSKDYKPGTLFQLLMKGCDAAGVVDDWYYQAMKADLRIRRARTEGCIVIETTDILFASRTLSYHPTTKVNIKEP